MIIRNCTGSEQMNNFQQKVLVMIMVGCVVGLIAVAYLWMSTPANGAEANESELSEIIKGDDA